MSLPYHYEWTSTFNEDIEDLIDSSVEVGSIQRTITKQALAELIVRTDSAINAHMKKGLTALNPGGKPLVFDYEHAKEFYRKQGINL